ncbi:MAG: asparagine synthase-related protein, partial [Cyclobacteriaceae bacterium]
QHGITVLLGGQGGDELSMGYPWMVQRLAAYSLNKGRVTLFADVLKSRYVKLPVAARILLGGFFPAVEKKFRLIMRKRQKSWLRTPLQIPSPAVSFGTSTGFDEIYRESLYSVGLPHLCHYDDRSTMARSIEGRMPFLDHRLFEFVSRLREDAFYRNGLSKYLLRVAFHAELPDCIRTRKDK